MRLFVVELRRAWLRSAVRLMSLLVLIAASAIVSLSVFQMARPVTASERAAADQIAAQMPTMSAAEIAQCEADRAAAIQAGNSVQGWTCGQPTGADFLRHPDSIWQALGAQPVIAGMLLALLGLVCGASFIGAEFHTGAIGNELTYESRRWRVYSAKVAAIVAWTLGVGIVTVGVSLGVGWLVGLAAGGTEGTPVGGLSHFVWLELRAAALGAVAALAAAGLAFLTRHTAAVIGVSIGYMFVENLLMGFANWLQPFSLTLNLQAILTGSASYSTYPCGNNTATQACEPVNHVIHGGQASLLVAALALALAAIGWLAFRRRDIN